MKTKARLGISASFVREGCLKTYPFTRPRISRQTQNPCLSNGLTRMADVKTGQGIAPHCTFVTASSANFPIRRLPHTKVLQVQLYNA